MVKSCCPWWYSNLETQTRTKAATWVRSNLTTCPIALRVACEQLHVLNVCNNKGYLQTQ